MPWHPALLSNAPRFFSLPRMGARRESVSRLLGRKRLILILDLDHTLLNRCAVALWQIKGSALALWQVKDSNQHALLMIRAVGKGPSYRPCPYAAQ
jgi:hypothetical protein